MHSLIWRISGLFCLFTFLMNYKNSLRSCRRVVNLKEIFTTWSGEFSAEEKVPLYEGQLALESVQLKSSGDMALWLKPVE
jgi:hypothetical protein